MRWHIHKWQYWWHGVNISLPVSRVWFSSHRLCHKCGRNERRIKRPPWYADYRWTLESITPTAKANITKPRPKYEYTWHPRCF